MARLRDLCRLAGPHSHLDGDGLKTDLTDYFMYTIGPLTLLYIGYEMTKCTPDERKKLAAAMVFVLFSVIFWAFFEQSGGSGLFAANNLDDTLLGIKVDPNGVNNSSNSLFVIAFSPLFGLLWVALAKKKREPNTVVKFGLGFLLAAAFVFYATHSSPTQEHYLARRLLPPTHHHLGRAVLAHRPVHHDKLTRRCRGDDGHVVSGRLAVRGRPAGAGMSTHARRLRHGQAHSYTAGYQQLGLYALIAGVVLTPFRPWCAG